MPTVAAADAASSRRSRSSSSSSSPSTPSRARAPTSRRQRPSSALPRLCGSQASSGGTSARDRRCGSRARWRTCASQSRLRHDRPDEPAADSQHVHSGVMYAGAMALKLAHNALQPSPGERTDPSSTFLPSAAAPPPPAPAPAPAPSSSTYFAAADTLLGGLVSHAQTWPSTFACVTALCRLRDSVLAPPAALDVSPPSSAAQQDPPSAPPPPPSSVWPEPLGGALDPPPPPLAHVPALFGPATVDLAHSAMQGMPGLAAHPTPGEQPLWNTVAAMGDDELAGFWDVWAAAGCVPLSLSLSLSRAASRACGCACAC